MLSVIDKSEIIKNTNVLNERFNFRLSRVNEVRRALVDMGFKITSEKINNADEVFYSSFNCCLPIGVIGEIVIERSKNQSIKPLLDLSGSRYWWKKEDRNYGCATFRGVAIVWEELV